MVSTAKDKFNNRGYSGGPASNAAASIRSDTVDLDFVTDGIYVGVAGDLKVTMDGGQTVVFQNVPAGSVLPIRVSRIWLTGGVGTMATNVIALWD